MLDTVGTGLNVSVRHDTHFVATWSVATIKSLAYSTGLSLCSAFKTAKAVLLQTFSID